MAKVTVGAGYEVSMIWGTFPTLVDVAHGNSDMVHAWTTAEGVLFQLTGEGFQADANGVLTAGIVDKIAFFATNDVGEMELVFAISGVSLAYDAFNDYLVAQDGFLTMLDALLSGADEVIGAAGADQLFGAAGRDKVLGDQGDDELWGDAGADTLIGGAGDDILIGGAGPDVLRGGAGFDFVDYWGDATKGVYVNLSTMAATLGGVAVGAGKARDGVGALDSLYGVEGVFGTDFNDWVLGSARHEWIYGEGGRDVLKGAAGDDVLSGDAGNDVLAGGAGDDVLMGGEGADRLIGGAGWDLVDYFYEGGERGVIFNLSGVDKTVGGQKVDKGTVLALDGGAVDVIQSVEAVIGTNDADAMFGSAAAETFWGDDGADTLIGGGGTDVLSGDYGDDRLFGGGGIDRLFGGAGADTLVGGGGADLFMFEQGDNAAAENVRDVIVDFRSGTDRINLKRIDADAATDGNQALLWIMDDGFSGHGGEVRFEGGFLQIDLDGDKNADMEIVLNGVTALTAADLIL